MVRALGRARSSAVEHLTFNQRVDGSIPSGLTRFAKASFAAIFRLPAKLSGDAKSRGRLQTGNR